MSDQEAPPSAEETPASGQETPPSEPATTPDDQEAPPADPEEPAREPSGAHDLDEAADPPADTPSSSPPVVAAPSVAWTDGWNPAVPAERRLLSPNRRARGAAKIDRVVIHITGTSDFAAARDSFMSAARQASAHYCIDRNGDLYQFVAEDDVAWHAGIHSTVAPVYRTPDGTWRKYKRYFSWHRGYPADAVFLDRDLNPCPKERAALVARADGTPWDDYTYFNGRWGEGSAPVGYAASKAINQHSIGIETVGHGGASPAAYTDAMYVTLAALVADICARHDIPRKFGHVCGHEDVNPVERWGWDPGRGFDWSRVVET